jgi:2-polyprenyl-3-methyl-5-hydroxy-6-metoxy-1,4-benzoquinol methylase
MMIEVPCNLCGDDDWMIRFASTTNHNGTPQVDAFRCTSSGYGEHLQIVQCRRCGLVYANPRWAPDNLLAAYEAVEDETYVLERSGREKTFARHLAAAEQIIGPGNGRRLLDVGAYIGIFVETAAAAGWDAVGVEPSAWAAAEAARRGVPVLHGTLTAPALAGEQFDAVTLWDVIEHVHDPAAEIQRAYERLVPGGWIVIHTMDVESALARLMGARWPWLMDMHLTYFSRQTLAKMVAQAGFDVVEVAPHGRYLSLGYLATRVGGISETLGRNTSRLVSAVGLDDRTVLVNFGDLITLYARRPA